MISLRLKTIASLIDKEAIVLDVGTDHAYLPIYLIKNNLCQKVIASDISKGALTIAQNNLNKYHINNVKLILSDGLKNINETYDTLVIAGMGFYTIKGILESGNIPSKIIISSNNNLELLRKYMYNKNYRLEKEIVIKENNKYYSIIFYIHGKDKLSKRNIKYGLSNNKEYYKYLYLQSKIKFKYYNLYKKIKFLPDLLYLKKEGLL